MVIGRFLFSFEFYNEKLKSLSDARKSFISQIQEKMTPDDIEDFEAELAMNQLLGKDFGG